MNNTEAKSILGKLAVFIEKKTNELIVDMCKPHCSYDENKKNKIIVDIEDKLNKKLTDSEVEKALKHIGFVQGVLVVLDVDDSFESLAKGMRCDFKETDFPGLEKIPQLFIRFPCYDNSEKIVPELARMKKKELNLFEDKKLFGDLSAYTNGNVPEEEKKYGLLFLPSAEITLWSTIYLLLFFNPENDQKKWEKLFNNSTLPKKKNDVFDPEKTSPFKEALRMLGLINKDGGETEPKTERMKTLLSLEKDVFSFWIKSIYNLPGTADTAVNEFSDLSIKFISGLDNCIKKKNYKLPSLPDSLIKSISYKPSWKKGFKEHISFDYESSNKIRPRFNVRGEMEIRSYDTKDRDLILNPKEIYYDAEGNTKLNKYFIGGFQCKSSLNNKPEDPLNYLEEYYASHKDDFQNFQKSVDSLFRLFDFVNQSKVRIELQKKREQIKWHATKSAIAAIMSRNGSHNLGSHVIFNVIKDIDKLNVQANRQLFKYLQQRMDFLAQISTAWVPEWTSSSWLAKELMKGFLEQEHVLNYIARSEGLQVKPDTDKIRKISKFIVKQKKEKGKCIRKIIIQLDIGDKDSADESANSNQKNMRLDEDILMAIPGGNVGFHAFYTIIENFIRNAAKHEFSALPQKYQQKKSLKINLEIQENVDKKSYTVRLWDNLSYISTNAQNLTVLNSPFDSEDILKEKLEVGLNELRLNKISENGNSINKLEKLEKGPDYEAKIISVIPEKGEFKIDIENMDLSSTDFKINPKHFIFIVHPYDEYNKLKRPMIIKDFQNMANRKNVRFISEPRWCSFLEGCDWPEVDDDKDKKVEKQTTIKQKFVKLLWDVWKPTHDKLNKDLRNELINNDGSLRRENWGLSEMKICAGYLQKEKISAVGLGGENVLDIIKTVPVPEYIKRKDFEKGVRAYRMGYEFKIYKPKETLVIGLNDFNNEEKNNLERQSIYIRQGFEESDDFDFDFVVIAGDAVKEFIEKTSCSDEYDFIEMFPYRIILVTDKDNKIFKKDQFLEKRLALCSEKDLAESNNILKKHFETRKNDQSLIKKLELYEKELAQSKNILKKHLEFCASDNIYFDNINLSKVEAFKLRVYEIWIKHLKKKLRGLDGEIYVVSNPTDGKSENGDADFSDFFKVLDATFDDEKKSALRLTAEDKGKVHNVCAQAIPEYFGYYNKYYQPKTLPDPPFIQKAEVIDKTFVYSFNNSLGDSLKWPGDMKNDPDKHIKTISYIRHHHLCKQLECKISHPDTPVYDENTGGASAHFPILSNIPSSREKPYLHKNAMLKLIENGLLRIAIADERSWDYLIERPSLAEELTLCGIYPVQQLLTFKMEGKEKHWDKVNVLKVDKNNDKLKILPQECKKPDAIIIHQGILDKIKWNDNYQDENIFLKELKKEIPIVVVTSGRGEPSNLSKYVKFLGFSILEQHIISDPHSKLILTDSLMKLSRKYNKEKNKYEPK